MHFHKPFKMKFVFKGCISLLFFSSLISPSFSQTQNTLSTGSSNKLSISLTNTMGVQTSADLTNTNVKVENEATLILGEGSKIATSSDEEGVTGDFVVSPTGSSFNIKGLQAENFYDVGGSTFSSKMTSVDEPDSSKPIKGNASASLVHNMNLTIDQTNSSFTQSFSRDF